MRNRPILGVFVGGLLAAVALLSFAPRSVASPQLTPPCKCKAVITLSPDPNCPCPGISVSNVITAKGECARQGGFCNGASTLSCSASGTVSETGCTGGITDQPW